MFSGSIDYESNLGIQIGRIVWKKSRKDKNLLLSNEGEKLQFLFLVSFGDEKKNTCFSRGKWKFQREKKLGKI